MGYISISYGKDGRVDIPLPGDGLRYLRNELVRFDGERYQMMLLATLADNNILSKLTRVTTEVSTNSGKLCTMATTIQPTITCPQCHSNRIDTFNENLSKCMQCGKEFRTGQ